MRKLLVRRVSQVGFLDGHNAFPSINRISGLIPFGLTELSSPNSFFVRLCLSDKNELHAISSTSLCAKMSTKIGIQWQNNTS